MNNFPAHTHLVRTVVASGLLLLSLLVTLLAIVPINEWLFPDTFVGAILIYIPHGIRTIAAWLFGWLSAIYLLPANILVLMFTGSGELGVLNLLIMLAVVTLSAPLAFRILAFVGFDMRSNPALRFNWRAVVFAGGIASLINAIALHTVRFHSIPAEEHLLGIMYWVIGDVIGVVVVFMGMLLVDRRMRSKSG